MHIDRSTTGFFTLAQQRSGLPAEDFKAAVVNNHEIIALIGALVITTSFAVPIVSDDKDWTLLMETAETESNATTVNHFLV
jgi:hypothetical protein